MSIGGFFELELGGGSIGYHADALALSTGRACLNLALKVIQPRRVYLPYYTCDALFEPMQRRDIPYEFYSIDERLEPVDLPSLDRGDLLIYINYFGLKTEYVEQAVVERGPSLLVDNTHNFFAKSIQDVWSFTSARKYFGVPDGAYVYAPVSVDHGIDRNDDVSIAHSVNRLVGRAELAYTQYVAYEKTLNSEIRRISVVSERLLSLVDYPSVRKRRRENFSFLHRELGGMNSLQCPPEEDIDPFCYPLLPTVALEKEPFHEKGFFIPTFWSDTWNRAAQGFAFEKRLSRELLPLPVDHRYSEADLSRLVEFIHERVRSAR